MTDAIPRPAVHTDIDELVRLRKFLLSDGTGHYVAHTPEQDAAWQSAYRTWLRARLPGTSTTAVVACGIAGQDSLVGCAIAVIDERAPTAECLNGKVGWLQTVVVDPAHRGRGLGAAIVEYTLEWLRDKDVSQVTLRTTPAARPLYRSLGFQHCGEDTLLCAL
jgi:GNAT superfamily N-acetyltransferase